MEIVGETNFMMSFFSSILFRLPNLLNLISYFLVIYALILLIKCLKIYIKNNGSIIFGVGDSHTSFIWNKK